MHDLQERLLKFAIRVIKFCQILENTIENRIIKNQLIKSATSAGANYEESQGTGSKADFKNKVRIAFKEMRECKYWLNVLEGTLTEKNKDEVKSELSFLLDESEQLKRIFGSICKPSEKNH